jgi:xanthosine utilization system XapX-like protein
VLGASAYQILKLYVASGVALLIVLLSSLFFGYREYRSLEIIQTDESVGRKIKSSIELTTTTTKLTAYLGIFGGALLLAGCVFIVAVLNIDGAAPPSAKVLFSALALVGLRGLIIGARILRGKSLLSGYPLRKP